MGQPLNKSESQYFNTAVKMDRALLELLDIKDFEYITVREICERAGVNRSTFYLHYENTVDLLNESVRYMLDSFISYFPEQTVQAAHEHAVRDLSELNFISEKYLYPYLTYIKENKRIFITALNNAKSMEFEQVYRRLFRNIFDPILERFNYPRETRGYAMMFYLNGINAVVSEWIKNGCADSVEFIADVIKGCVLGRQ